jgi:putative ABC transport system permease protein
MRQRALSTWLTLLSVLLGVGLATAVMILYRGGGALFGQTEFGYDVLVGPPKGSALQLVMNTIYQIDESSGVVPYAVYEDLLKNRANVKIAVPYAVGDTYKNHRIIGTATKLFGVDDEGNPLPPERVLEYKTGRRYSVRQGHVFHPLKFEAVIGSDVTARTGLKLGNRFKATHGLSQAVEKPDAHVHEAEWTVVGVLEPTHTAADRVIFIPLVSFYAIREHEEGMEQQAEIRKKLEPAATTSAAVEPPATDEHDEHDEHDGHAHDEPYHLHDDGTIHLNLPKEAWTISAILAKARSSFAAMGLVNFHFKVIDNRANAVNPASVMREFFNTYFHASRTVLVTIAWLVSVVASVGILVSIYNSVSARAREIAILRALGATRGKILMLICAEAGLIGLLGGVLGLVIGHLLGAVGSLYLNRLLGEGIPWLHVGPEELLYLAVVVAIAVIAGLVPALKAYRVPVATNLAAV